MIMTTVTTVRALHYLGAIGIVANLLLATVLFGRLVRPVMSFAWSRFDASHRPLSFALRAEWLQRGFLTLSAVLCLYIFVATASAERGEALIHSMIDR